MGERLENLRLQLITTDEKESKGKKSHRAKNCCIYSVIQVCCVFVFLILIFIALRVVEIQKVLKKKEKKPEPSEIIPGSEFCKSVNGENMSLVAIGYLKGIKEERSAMDAKNQIYYVTDRLLTDQEACAIEALLRLFQDKSIFVVEIGNFSDTSSAHINYVTFLREQYTNLNSIKSTQQMFLKGSPFEKKGNFSIFAAKVLLVWQFGGTVLSPNLLLLTRRMFDNNEGFCEVEKEFLFCPNQCSAYVYQLIKTLLDLDSSKSEHNVTKNETIEHVIDKSVVDYCGDKEAVFVGCVGVNRIKPHNVCNMPNKNCDFLRVQEWKVKDLHWKNDVQKFCPKIVARYIPGINKTNSLEERFEEF